MSKFIRGGRQKLGCVFLALTVIVSGAWIRSVYKQDDLLTPFFALHIRCGTVAWMEAPNVGWIWSTQEINAETFTGFAGIWRWTKQAIAVPYWSLLLPVAILSAYLILWPGKHDAKSQTPKVRSPDE